MAVSTGVNEKLLEEVFATYTAAEEIMLAKLAAQVNKGVTSGWAHNKTADIAKVKQELESTLAQIHKKVLPGTASSIISAYLKGANSANVDLKLPKTALKDLQVPYHVQRLILDANGIIKGASLQILRESTDAYRAIVADSTSMILTGVEGPREAAQRALNSFAAKGITGFTDKAGKKWEMASYVEMAVRTTSQRAALQGHIDRSTEIGHDLMIVSHFGRTCPKCAPWEGVPLSISGNTPGYATLEQAKAAGLFHPRCKHTLLAYFPGITDIPQRYPNDTAGYNAISKQRANERQIRKWKRVGAVAMDPISQKKAAAKVAAWQAVQRQHIMANNLRRDYSRESIKNRIGNAQLATKGVQELKFDEGSWSNQQAKAYKQATTPPKAKAKPTVKSSTSPPIPVINPAPRQQRQSTLEQLITNIPNFLMLRDIKNGLQDVSKDTVAIKGMSEAERASIIRYSGSAYRPMNEYLRLEKLEANASIIESVETLKATIPKYSTGLTGDTIMMRHMDRHALPSIFDQSIADDYQGLLGGDTGKLDDIKKKVVGGTFTDKAFLSSSYKPGVFVEHNGVEIQMLMPKGYKNGMFIESVSNYKEEKEYLINAGQKFKIVDVAFGEVSGSTKNLIIKVMPMDI